MIELKRLFLFAIIAAPLEALALPKMVNGNKSPVRQPIIA